MTPILRFIFSNLGDDFSSKIVWDSVKDHHHMNDFRKTTFACMPCQSHVYPCDRLREVAAYFAHEKDYDESWTPRQTGGNLES